MHVKWGVREILKCFEHQSQADAGSGISLGWACLLFDHLTAHPGGDLASGRTAGAINQLVWPVKPAAERVAA